jgi:cationic peptide transport system substrate-binding protein
VLAWPAASQLTILRDDPRLRLTLRPGMNIAYLAFNTDKPPLNNLPCVMRWPWRLTTSA